MHYDFDQVINHRNTNSLKWDLNAKLFGSHEVLSMWVADMDFNSPPEVTEALITRAQYGVYAYSQGMDSYYQAIIDWIERRHGWKIECEWISYSPGIVPALNWILDALTKPGDKVLLQSPVYPPFFDAIKNNCCELLDNELKLIDGKFEIDFADLESKLSQGVKIFFLCSPHNPVGRVWTKDELQRIGEICLRYGVIVVADEIHFDLVYDGNKHTVFATLSEELAQNTIVCTAPSKTFNLAGLQMGNLVIPNPKLRKAFVKSMESCGINRPNNFGITATEAAYRCGEEWLEQLLKYLLGNLNYLMDFCETKLPKIKVIKPEGTYLVWMDFRELGIEPDRLREIMLKEAKVALNDGRPFGPSGRGFQRMNIACPRSILEEGLRRMESVLGK